MTKSTFIFDHLLSLLPDGDFSEKPGSIKHIPTPCKVSEETNNPIPRKLPECREGGWTDGRSEGQTLIHKILLAMAGGPIGLKYDNAQMFEYKQSTN